MFPIVKVGWEKKGKEKRERGVRGTKIGERVAKSKPK